MTIHHHSQLLSSPLAGEDQGGGGIQFFFNDFQNGFHFLQDLMIPKPQHIEPLRLQPVGPLMIVNGPFGVLSPIYLNN